VKPRPPEPACPSGRRALPAFGALAVTFLAYVPHTGSRLGPYEILAPLGAGGMGEVYRARDTRLGRDVAIKVLPSHLSEYPEVRQRSSARRAPSRASTTRTSARCTTWARRTESTSWSWS